MKCFSTKSRLYVILFLLTLLMFLPLRNSFAQNDVTNKLMVGYQGWFLCEGDGSSPGDWRHWFNSHVDPSASNIGIDFWPEMDEYNDTYNTDMTYEDGSTAKLFSSHDASTTNLHFKWMKEYNIYGAYLQRFLGSVTNDNRFFEFRNHVLENVIDAAEEYNRHFAVMYDISGVEDDGNLYNKLINDWEYLVDTYDVLNKEGYVHQDDRPVIAIWGIGFSNRGLNPSTFVDILDYFHNTADPKYQAYVMGGVPSRWRTLEGDSESDPAWTGVYNSLDMISPWTVGRYNNQSGIDNWKYSKIIPDLTACNSNGIDYMPVIWPGFSWQNIHDGPLNQIPRDGGKYYWRQAYNVVDAGVEFIYVAMFDEVDEGTAIFKIAETKSQIPVELQNKIVPLDADGYVLPSDWYLQLAGETQNMLDGTIDLTSTIPISPYKDNFISHCDSKKGWSSSNTLTINSSDQKKGSGCLQSVGSETDDFTKEFPWSFSVGSSTSLGFWYYISDVSLLESENQVELGSGGASDINEYHWVLDNSSLENGWNYVNLYFSDAQETGGTPDMDALNWFKIYHVKSGSITTRIDDIKLRGDSGNQMPVADAGPNQVDIDNDDNESELITLDGSGSLEFDGSISSYSWTEAGSQIATGVNPTISLSVGTHNITLIVTDNDGAVDEDQLTIIIYEEFIDNCDSETDWNSSNTLTVNTNDQKQGTGCLQSVGSGADEFIREFSWPLSADSSTSLGFWYYISDVSLFESENQVELGSGGEPDVNEYHWVLDNSSLENGWNYINLEFKTAEITGGEPDMNSLNWFRIYHLKSGNMITRIDAIKFRGGSGNQLPVADAGSDQAVSVSDSTDSQTVILDGSESFDYDGTIVNYSWTEMDSEIATGVNPTVVLSAGHHTITLRVTDNEGATDDDQVIIIVSGGFLDNCDSKTGWASANTLTVNTTDQKQGVGCLEAVGSGTDDYKKTFSPVFSVDPSASLAFWYYVSDISQLESSNQVELGSAGKPDSYEYNWQLNNLENGWNYITLKFSEAGITGGEPDLDGINWFRLYRFKSGDVTTRIDGIKFSGGNSNQMPIANAGQNITVSDNDGSGSELVTLDGSGSSDSDGEIVNYSWKEEDSEIATGKNPTVELLCGVHTITLIITDNGGATATDQVTVTVEASTAINGENGMPDKYSLSQNYPNPFNPNTTIKYGLKENSFVKISIYNLNGELVKTLVNSQKTAGYHQIIWNVNGIPSGVYLYKIDVEGKFREIRKCILMK